MFNMEILEEFLGSNDHSIVKGKRTKRQRPSSSTLSSSGATVPTSGGGGGYYSLVTSPTTSTSTNIEEDEDMANCLILLAQSVVSLPKNSTKTKDRIYTYECKTCNRSFPSFQALGGHKASHRKPKQLETDRKETPVDAPSGDHEEEEGWQSHKSFHGYTHDKPKIHECSICGSEFSSGQALGGHMRRHRNPNSTRVNQSSSRDAEKTRNILALDLNLPAPAEDDHGPGSESGSGPETKFRFSSNHQGLVCYAVALVDCHY
ncbi:zinc finger ZAT5-like [Olea europaea subsp. europaea]|uniref:Zinc finger ZAT5-like n=1 Tax=Olea europaea subsp. europaea TaxID=158383 RepID=A0A8S0QBI9_OLEEU|nr:zinc finger ZAT5-like [Olea europaea subsp. europaea]